MRQTFMTSSNNYSLTSYYNYTINWYFTFETTNASNAENSIGWILKIIMRCYADQNSVNWVMWWCSFKMAYANLREDIPTLTKLYTVFGRAKLYHRALSGKIQITQTYNLMQCCALDIFSGRRTRWLSRILDFPGFTDKAQKGILFRGCSMGKTLHRTLHRTQFLNSSFYWVTVTW